MHCCPDKPLHVQCLIHICDSGGWISAQKSRAGLGLANETIVLYSDTQEHWKALKDFIDMIFL